MVDKDLSTEAADAIDKLLQLAQNGQRPSVDQIVRYSELSDELRDSSGTEYDMPEVGDNVWDIESDRRPRMQVIRVHPDTRADEYEVDVNVTVSDHNPDHPDDAPVVEIRFPGSPDTYSYPVTRLEW
jgi:hypothetical protein